MKNTIVDTPQATRDFGTDRLRISGKLLARSKETGMMANGKGTGMQQDAIVAARGGVATGGVWRSGRMMLAMVALFVSVFTFAGIKPTQTEAFIGWCRKCLAAEAVVVLADSQISLPQATDSGVSEPVDIYIHTSEEYSVDVSTAGAFEGNSPLLCGSAHSAVKAPEDFVAFKGFAQRLVVPQPALT